VVRACRLAAKATTQAARHRCRDARSQCRTCCRAGREGCAAPGEEPKFSGIIPRIPDRGILDALSLPPAPDGRGYSWVGVGEGTLTFDPTRRTPVSAAAECAAIVLRCFDATSRNWAGCFEAVPVCSTDEPWIGDDPMCCPSACASRYQALRKQGLDGPGAFTAAIWDEPSCVPELEGRTTGQP
jgi:hypothetical protein